MTPTEFAEIAAAFAKDPASVQLMQADGSWRTLEAVCFLDSRSTYRLTPKPREWWVVIDTAVVHVVEDLNYKGA